MKYLLSITTRVVTGKLSWGGGAIKCYWRTGPTLQPTAVSSANDHLLIIIEIHQKVQYIMLSSLDSIVQIVKPHVLSKDLIFSFHFQKNFIKQCARRMAGCPQYIIYWSSRYVFFRMINRENAQISACVWVCGCVWCWWPHFYLGSGTPEPWHLALWSTSGQGPVVPPTHPLHYTALPWHNQTLPGARRPKPSICFDLFKTILLVF